MMATDTTSTAREVRYQDSLRAPSPRPIILITSFRRSSFSNTMALTVMATEKIQASVMAMGRTTIMDSVNLQLMSGAFFPSIQSFRDAPPPIDPQSIFPLGPAANMAAYIAMYPPTQPHVRPPHGVGPHVKRCRV